MATWMELHCEHCRHPGNGYPMAMAETSVVSVLATLRVLKQEALELGWNLINGKWYCKDCIQQRRYNVAK